MKLALASDIHTEIQGQRMLELQERVDVLILAGDIGKGVQSVEYAKQFLDKASDIVLVFGNHDYWRASDMVSLIQKTRQYIADNNIKNVHFLENDMVTIDGINFIGATAWTDFTYGGANMFLNMRQAEQFMNDYRFIKFKSGQIYRKLRAEDVQRINFETKNYIFDTLESVDRMKSVVVTHHAPTHLSINPKFLGDEMNHSYTNQWGDLIAYRGPKLWCHGHMHDPSDYMVGDTRVLCNPIGYPGQYDHTQIKVFDF